MKRYNQNIRMAVRRRNLLSKSSIGATKRWTDDLSARKSARETLRQIAVDTQENEIALRKLLAKITN